MLYIFGGLPGTGKSTLSQILAQRLRAVHLRIDVIEQAMRESGISVDGPQGYVVAYRLASHHLRLGMPVVADSVNPIEITREAWRQAAQEAGADWVEIEVICSDRAEHRRRVETRAGSVPGLRLPTWPEVEAREYEPWAGSPIVIDTAGQTVEACLSGLLRAVRQRQGPQGGQS